MEPPRSSDSFSSLPPEILSKIYSEESLVDVRNVSVCSSLYPFTIANAYRSLLVQDDVTLAALGETYRVSGRLGQLVERFEYREKSVTRVMHDDTSLLDVGLQPSLEHAFENMPNLVEIQIYRPGDLSSFLTSQLIHTKAFQNIQTLILSSPDPIPYSALQHLHLAKSLINLDIRSPMSHTVGNPSGIFQPSMSAITKLTINAEPHSADFEAFFAHLPLLSDLRLRSSVNVATAVRAMAPSTRKSLQSFSFSTTGYLQEDASEAFSDFECLQHLVLWSIFKITPAFFRFISPIVSMQFHGPQRNLRHITNFVTGDSKPASLVEIAVDIATCKGYRNERELLALQEACTMSGVNLSSYFAGAVACSLV